MTRQGIDGVGAGRAESGETRMAQATAYHLAGRLDRAGILYRLELINDPAVAPALNLLGVIHHQSGQSGIAVGLIRRALSLQADVEAYYANLALALTGVKQFTAAIPLCRTAILLRPDYAEAFINLSSALHQLGEMPQAALSARRSIYLRPERAETHYNLAIISKELGQSVDAEAFYRRAVILKPGYPEAFNNLGNLVRERGAVAEATTLLKRAVALGYLSALSNFGDSLINIGEVDRGLGALRLFLVMEPQSAAAYNNYGKHLQSQGALSPAVLFYRRAVELQPDLIESLNNLGNALIELGHSSDARTYFEKALRLAPRQPKIFSNYLLALNYHSDLSPAEIFAAHNAYDARMADYNLPLYRQSRDPGRRLKIGFLSADLRRHSVAYFLEPLIRNLDREGFHITCYADLLVPDAVSDRLRANSDQWQSVFGMSDADLVARIHADEIDILVDLAGHTAKNRLAVFAARPAPVQVSWLGYPNTSGLTAMAYRFVDAITDPTSEMDVASEELVRLPGGFLCYQPPADAPIPKIGRRADTGVVFGSFNNPAKLSPETLDIWASLLRNVPTSRLLLKGLGFADPTFREDYFARFEVRGVSRDRIRLLGKVSPVADHLSLYGDIDVALDPIPYNGTTTTCEALWMGVPVVTIRGDRHAARVGASLLTHLGLEEWVAENIGDYITIAKNLASDRSRLGELRATLRPRMAASPLCDGPAFGVTFGAALRGIWQRHCKMEGHAVFRMVDGVRVVAPNLLDLITPYVLTEQQDWFEDELRFLRRVVQPGQSVIDVGANHGVYSLALARAVGPRGKVYAFEPTATTAQTLEWGAEINGFHHVEVVRCALADHVGEARFSRRKDSELNRILPADASEDASEAVSVSTLDVCRDTYDWRTVDLIKIDAEGAEEAILRGGSDFFSRFSPLVQFEIRHNQAINYALIEGFRSGGYEVYRLVPGLSLLCPIAAGVELDPYLLNLFACKGDRARSLASAEFLVPDHAMATAIPHAKLDRYGWRRTIVPLPYAADLAPIWGADGNDFGDIEIALSCYALSRDTSRPPDLRYDALAESVRLLDGLCANDPPITRLGCLARAASDFGARRLAVTALQQMTERIIDSGHISLTEPFFPPCHRFDHVVPIGGIGNWLLAAAIEAFDRGVTFSSFYSKGNALKRLQNIEYLGYADAETERRRKLVETLASRVCLRNSGGLD